MDGTLAALQADLAAVAALAGQVAAWRDGVATAALAAGWPVAQAGPQAALLLDAGLSVTLRPSLQVLAMLHVPESQLGTTCAALRRMPASIISVR